MASMSPFRVGAKFFALSVVTSAYVITHAPINDMVRPKIAIRDGLSLNMKLETSMEKIGVVLTRTVAFRMVVSFTADAKNMKWRPMNVPRISRLFRFSLTSFELNFFFNTINIVARPAQAIMRRQKTIEKASMFGRSLMRIAAVPNKIPAIAPSVNASFLVFALIFWAFAFALVAVLF